MDKRVLMDPNQYLTDLDILRMGLFPQEGMDRLTAQLLISSRMFKGFVVTASGNTAVEISGGTLWDAGRMSVALATEMSLAEYVPLIAGQQVIVTLIGQFREQDGYSETRNYEEEVAVSGGGTTTQIIPTQKNRVRVRDAVLTLLPGSNSAIPVRPSVPAPAVAIADIRLGTGGILEIVPRTENEAPELDLMASQIAAAAIRQALTDQAIAGIRTDIAALWRAIRGSASQLTIDSLVTDMTQVKDRLMIPDTGSPYGGDWFLNEDESDADHPDFNAIVREGIRFPWANFWEGPVALYNANDPNLRHASQGFICPKYTAVPGIVIDKATGEMPLGGTEFQTLELQQLVMSREEIAYGDWFTKCENASEWKNGKYDPIAGILKIGNETYQVGDAVGNIGRKGHQIYRIRKFWKTTVDVAYDNYVPVPHVIQGVIKSQTFVMSQGRYIPRIRLGIKRWGAGAQITAILCEAREDGTPNPKRILDKVTVSAAQFKAWPEWTEFPFSVPAWAAPEFYGVMLATTGDVVVATADGSGFLGGTLFDSTDGVWMRGDLTKDLCMAVDFCRFDIVSMPVQLQGLSLDGGIHNYRNKVAAIVPENATADWELQRPDGTWARITLSEGEEPALFGQGNTPFYQHRVMLNGNQWEMPLIDMAQSEVAIFRAATAEKHISEPYQMPVGVTAEAVTVSVVLEDWNALRHTAVMKLRHGAGLNTVKAHSAVSSKPVLNRPSALQMTWTFEFAAGAGVNAFAFQFEGSTDNARFTFHVENRAHSTETA